MSHFSQSFDVFVAVFLYAHLKLIFFSYPKQAEVHYSVKCQRKLDTRDMTKVECSKVSPFDPLVV